MTSASPVKFSFRCGQPGRRDRTDDFAAGDSTCPATTDPIAARPSKTSDFAGLADLAEPSAQAVQTLDRRFPADDDVRKHPAAVDSKVIAVTKHFTHLADRRVEIGIRRAGLARQRAHQPEPMFPRRSRSFSHDSRPPSHVLSDQAASALRNRPTDPETSPSRCFLAANSAKCWQRRARVSDRNARAARNNR